MTEQTRDEVMDGLISQLEHPPSSNTLTFGYRMRDWLRDHVADPGTGVDTGAGSGEFDLWVKINGEELYITIKSKRALQ